MGKSPNVFPKKLPVTLQEKYRDNSPPSQPVVQVWIVSGSFCPYTTSPSVLENVTLALIPASGCISTAMVLTNDRIGIGFMANLTSALDSIFGCHWKSGFLQRLVKCVPGV